MRSMRLGLVMGGLLAFALTCALPAAEKAEAKKVTPSANAGRKGQYNAPTSVGDYSYHVFVPASYSDSNPAGLHIHFSGQGGCANNDYFGQWAKYFLEPHNLIGINMKYPDGDNMKNTAGKVAAAREAIAQVIADYRIVVGRGVICSFSGGGLPHGMLFSRSGKTRGPEFPFCQMAQYSSNFTARIPAGTCAMSWFFSVGSAEWGLASLGRAASSHMKDLLEQAAKGGDTDLYLKIMKGKGHNIDDAEVAQSAILFRRADLAHAPFVYEPDYLDEKLAPLAKQANALTLGPVLPALERILNDGKTAEDVKKKAEALKDRVSARVKAIMDMANGLAVGDPVLFTYYARKWAPQLAGLPEAKELQALAQKTTTQKDFPRWSAQLKALAEAIQQAFTAGGCTPLNVKAVPLMEDVQKSAPEKSSVGQMATEFLLLK